MPKPTNATSFCPAIVGMGEVPLDEEGNLVLDGLAPDVQAEVKRQYKATFKLQDDKPKADKG